MAVAAMKKIGLCVLKRDVKPVMEYLQRKGAVQIEKLKKRDGLDFPDTAYQVAYLEKRAQTASSALDIIAEYVPADGGLLSSLNGRRMISEKDYYEISGYCHETIRLCDNILTMSKQIAECRAEIARLNARVSSLEPWLAFGLRADLDRTASTRLFTGSCPEQTDADALYAAAGFNADAPVHIEIVNSDKQSSCIFAVFSEAFADEAEAALRKAGVIRLALAGRNLPSEESAFCLKRRDALEKAVGDLTALIEAAASEREKIKTVCDYYRLRADRNRETQKLLQSKSVCVICGYIPEAASSTISDDLTSRFAAAVRLDDAPRSDPDTPVKLKNNAFAAPAEGLLESYSMPSPRDIDPTAVMAFFYYLFFGIMYCDVGYGLLITIGCFFALKKFTLERTMRRSLTLFLYCGISSVIWGFVFGGFFGDIVSVVSREFFGHQVDFPALWVNPLNDPVSVLLFSIALGYIQVFTGMVINFIGIVRNDGVFNAVCDIGGWLVIFIGGMVAAAAYVSSLSFLMTAAIAVVIAGAAMVAFLGGHRNKNPFMKIFGGFAGLYNVTSYFSDIASYARLFALALAGGAFASAMNMVGSIATGFMKPIVLVIVFLIGTAINMALSFLSAYVHTLRLQYVEFFGKFYEGDGRPFEPYKAETKYIRFTEEM